MHRARVLLLEDNLEFRLALESNIRNLGYEVFGADSPEHIITWLQENPPFHAIISDLSMPSMNGLEVFKAIRHIDPFIPFILISGVLNKEVLIKAVPLGLSGVLEKPFSSVQLKELLEQAIAAANNGNERDLKAKLTRRQMEVIRGVAEGMSNREIAQGLQLTEQAIKYHVGVLLKTFTCKTRRDLRVKLARFL